MPRRVLIVEDNLLLSTIQKRIVEQLGYQVLAAVQTGQEAIEKAREENPDIILMDVSLNGDMDGIETMREIRRSSSVPVIYLSGSFAPKEMDNVITPVGFLTKPINKQQLEDCLEKAFVG